MISTPSVSMRVPPSGRFASSDTKGFSNSLRKHSYGLVIASSRSTCDLPCSGGSRASRIRFTASSSAPNRPKSASSRKRPRIRSWTSVPIDVHKAIKNDRLKRRP